MVYFLRITPVNFLYAWALSLRQPVGVWITRLPAWLTGRFRLVRPHELFSRDEWLLLHDRCFELWRDRAFPLLSHRHRCAVECSGLTVDYSRNLLQLMGIELERLFLFAATARRMAGDSGRAPVIAEPWVLRAFTREHISEMFPGVRFRHSAVQRWLEATHEWCIAFAHLGEAVVQFAVGLFSARRTLGRRSSIWLGISPQEIPDREARLDFSWAVQTGQLAPDDVLYFLPCRTSTAQRRYLEARRVTWVEPLAGHTILPLTRSIHVTINALSDFLRAAFFWPSTVGPLLARFMVRARYWQELFAELGVRQYFTTTSYSWPEKPELAVCRALGVRSVTWSYSANTLWFTRNAPAFRDVGIARSLMSTNEFWVWNTTVRDYYERRQVSKEWGGPRIVVTGAMMCGDAVHLGRSRVDARARLGISATGFLISIFDVPTVDDEWRRRFGGGPVSLEMAFTEAFFAGLAELLDTIPEISMLLKPKRSAGERYRPWPSTLLSLTGTGSRHMAAGRIALADVNCDPFLPIAAGDAAIGMPLTSPILAAASCGRPAVYFDPLGVVGQVPGSEMRNLCIGTVPELRALVQDWVHGAAVCPPPPSVDSRPVWADRMRLFDLS